MKYICRFQLEQYHIIKECKNWYCARKKIIAHLKLILFWLTQLRNDLLVLEIPLLKKSRRVKHVVIENIFFALEKKIIKVVYENANTIKTNDFLNVL